MQYEEEKKRFSIKIMGEEYILRSSSSRKHMLEVGEHVNSLMKELAEKYPRMSLQRIAVLASLNLASDLLSLKNQRFHNSRKKVTAQSKHK